MASILSFNNAFKRQTPKSEGRAFCFRCRYEWDAIAGVGVVDLECPKCGTMKGRFRFECQPPEGRLVRVCACGNKYFYLTQEGHMCVNCGIYQSY